MMCANNLMSLALMSVYLVVEPWVGSTELGRWVGMGNGNGGGELVQALAFMKRHPGVWWDVLGFAACGAVGQVFICKLLLLPLSSILHLLSKNSANTHPQSTHSQHSPPSSSSPSQ